MVKPGSNQNQIANQVKRYDVNNSPFIHQHTAQRSACNFNNESNNTVDTIHPSGKWFRVGWSNYRRSHNHYGQSKSRSVIVDQLLRHELGQSVRIGKYALQQINQNTINVPVAYLYKIMFKLTCVSCKICTTVSGCKTSTPFKYQSRSNLCNDWYTFSSTTFSVGFE